MSNKTLRINKGFGWIPDVPDTRDHLFATPLEILHNLPTKVDLRPQCPPIYDQGTLNCCTGNAIAAAIEFDLIKQNMQDFVPSRLFIYYNAREIEGNINSDAGAQNRNGFKSVHEKGVCPETEWTYDDDVTAGANSKYRQKPTQQCYTDALNTSAICYSQVSQTLDEMKGCLASGYPFVFGLSVGQSFIHAWHNDAVIPMPPPAPTDEPSFGHAALAVGFDDSQNRFICRNSWGTHDTGMGGNFTIPYEYLCDEGLANDFWTVRLIGKETSEL